MNANDLKVILEKHKMWLNDEDGGEMANLSRADLREANLSGTDLSRADLSRADLSRADLSRANLSGADLSGADLSGANLSKANLIGTDLHNTDMHRVDLNWAELNYADLSGANLRWVQHIESARNLFYPLTCPEKGEYTAFKKAGGKIVELRIPADAKRLSATGRKCRASKAVVISITTLEGDPAGNEVCGDYDKNFVYCIGETVEVNNFDENRWNECAPGIHHYITREEAIRHW